MMIGFERLVVCSELDPNCSDTANRKAYQKIVGFVPLPMFPSAYGHHLARSMATAQAMIDWRSRELDQNATVASGMESGGSGEGEEGGEKPADRTKVTYSVGSQA